MSKVFVWERIRSIYVSGVNPLTEVHVRHNGQTWSVTGDISVSDTITIYNETDTEIIITLWSQWYNTNQTLNFQDKDACIHFNYVWDPSEEGILPVIIVQPHQSYAVHTYPAVPGAEPLRIAIYS